MRSREVAPRSTPSLAAVLKDEERGRAAVCRNDYYEASKIFFGLLDKEKNVQRLIEIRFIQSSPQLKP
jgi:hypothetical protein